MRIILFLLLLVPLSFASMNFPQPQAVDITIAVLDTGALCCGFDFVNYDNITTDDHGHGTQIVEILDTLTTASQLIVKVCDENGDCLGADVAQGIEYALDPNSNGLFEDKVDIIMLALGAKETQTQVVQTAIEKALSLNVTVVTSVGNNDTVFHPGDMDGVLTVGAVSSTDVFYPYNSVSSSGLFQPELVATGEYCNGTCNNSASIAVAHATGAAAIVLNSLDLTPQELQTHFINTATQLDVYKLINVQNALSQEQLSCYPSLNPITNTSGQIRITGSSCNSSWQLYVNQTQLATGTNDVSYEWFSQLVENGRYEIRLETNTTTVHIPITIQNDLQQNDDVPQIISHTIEANYSLSNLRTPLSITFSEDITTLYYTIGSHIIDVSEHVQGNTITFDFIFAQKGVQDVTFVFADTDSNTQSQTFSTFVSINSGQLDSVIGNASSIVTDSSLSIFIDDSSNLGAQVTGVKPVRVSSPDIEISYLHDFSEKLDLTQFIILQEDESFVINGPQLQNNEKKTISLPYENQGVCIHDEDIISLDQLTLDCSGEDEFYVSDFPFVQNEYTFEVVNDELILQGLTHTGVTNMCGEVWDCSDWSSCSSGTQTRMCTDTNACGTILAQPVTSQSCSAPASSSGGGSGGGGSGGGAPPQKEIVQVIPEPVVEEPVIEQTVAEQVNNTYQGIQEESIGVPVTTQTQSRSVLFMVLISVVSLVGLGGLGMILHDHSVQTTTKKRRKVKH